MLRRSVRLVLAIAEFDVPASGLRSFDELGGICSASITNPDLPRPQVMDLKQVKWQELFSGGVSDFGFGAE